MPKKYLQLDDTRAYYDQKSGSVRLISKDKRLRGEPFQINLVRDAPTTESLVKLLTAEGLIDPREHELPARVALPRKLPPRGSTVLEAEYAQRRSDSRLNFLIGSTFGDRKIELDLGVAPHTLIAGRTGSGKSVLLNTIREQALDRPYSAVHWIDVSSKAALADTSTLRHQDRFAGSLEEAAKLVEALRRLMIERFKLMDKQSVNNWDQVEGVDPQYLFLDGLWSALPDAENYLVPKESWDIRASLGIILRRGRAAGIYSFSVEQRPHAMMISGEDRANMGRRIFMGQGDPNGEAMTLGISSPYGGDILEPQGRGVIRTYASKIRAFQAFTE